LISTGEADMAEEHRSVRQIDRNRSLRDRLSRGTGSAAIDLTTAELEIAVQDLQELARTRLA
jgi:hypothetical protein